MIGADKLMHDKPLYGNWPHDNANGDTYGPVNYYAYVPFRAIFGWSGSWDDLPAAHAAAIAFDLLTLIGLFSSGAAIAGRRPGSLLAYTWAAYPFTLYALELEQQRRAGRDAGRARRCWWSDRRRRAGWPLAWPGWRSSRRSRSGRCCCAGDGDCARGALAAGPSRPRR